MIYFLIKIQIIQNINLFGHKYNNKNKTIKILMTDMNNVIKNEFIKIAKQYRISFTSLIIK